MLEDNEMLENDVPETSEEELIETDASEEVEEVLNTTDEVETNAEDIEKQIEERANKIAEDKIQARLIRDRIKRERETASQRAKYEELENIMKTALDAESLDDVITKSRTFYKEQGINIPDTISKPSLNERDEKVLAEADAREIISLGKAEMEEEANRIASIPESQRSIREQTIFNEVCRELVNLNDIESLKEKGYDTEILNDKDFSSFREQFNLNTPISKIYEMYQSIKGTKPVQPKSPGSAKTNNSNNEIKDYYTPEEVRKFTEEDLDNPKLMEAIDRSMLLWGKNK